MLQFSMKMFSNLPGVNVAPPGNDDRVCGITFTLARELPLGCL